MIALLRKDLRLSLDVLRPWAVGVAALGLGLWGADQLPRDLNPLASLGSGASELLVCLATVIAATSAPVGGWIGATIVRGDELHGASLLAGVLPIGGAHRVRSKGLALLLGVAIPALVVVALLGMASLVASADFARPSLQSWRILPLGTAAGAAIGATGSAFVATRVRGTFASVTIGLLLAACCALAAWLGTVAMIPIAAGKLFAAAREYANPPELVEIVANVERSGTGWGLGIGMLTILLATAALAARPRGARWFAGAIALAIVASGVGGMLSVAPAFANDPALTRSPLYCSYLASQCSPEELAKAVRQRSLFGQFPPRLTPDEKQLLTAMYGRAWSYRREMSPLVRASDPVEQAFRSIEDFSSPGPAQTSLRLMPLDDPRWLPISLDCLARWPGLAQSFLLGLHDRRSLDWLALPAPNEERDRHWWDAFHERCRLRAIEELERRIAGGDPESDRMRRAVYALRMTPSGSDLRRWSLEPSTLLRRASDLAREAAKKPEPTP